MQSIEVAWPTGAFKRALVQHGRVVSALMLRDIKTRFGASYLGFIVGLLLPLGHIAIILSVYIFLGRRAPIGTDVMLYLTTAILPFVVWSYTHQKVMQAVSQNRVLTAFPIVKVPDLMIARAVVEALNATLIVIVVAATLAFLGRDLFVSDPARFGYALVLAYLLGVATGALLGIVAVHLPAVMLVGFLLIPLYWVTSGIFFIPDSLPAQAREIVAIFPLSHVVDFGRTAFYASYMSDYASLSYVHALIAGMILAALLLERLLRPFAP